MRGGFKPQVKKIPGGGHGNPFQYSYLENLMDGGAWQAIVHGVAQSDTTEQFSMHAHTISHGMWLPREVVWLWVGWGSSLLLSHPWGSCQGKLSAGCTPRGPGNNLMEARTITVSSTSTGVGTR